MFCTKFNPLVVDGTYNVDPSMTQQHFKDDCDINVLYKRFVKENGFDPVLEGPQYVYDMDHFNDVSSIKGLQGMFDKADEANNIFMQLPADVREKFDNNPAMLRNAIESFKDPKDLEKYGIVVKGAGIDAIQIKPENIQKDVPKDSTPNPQA